jgi:hypothetical protein
VVSLSIPETQPSEKANGGGDSSTRESPPSSFVALNEF